MVVQAQNLQARLVRLATAGKVQPAQSLPHGKVPLPVQVWQQLELEIVHPEMLHPAAKELLVVKLGPTAKMRPAAKLELVARMRLARIAQVMQLVPVRPQLERQLTGAPESYAPEEYVTEEYVMAVGAA